MARSRSRQGSDPAPLLASLEAGQRGALPRLLAWSREELRQYVRLRLDPRLAARFDASDVLQEVQITVTQRIDDYLQRKPMPFPLWLRKTALERLADLRR